MGELAHCSHADLWVVLFAKMSRKSSNTLRLFLYSLLYIAVAAEYTLIRIGTWI